MSTLSAPLSRLVVVQERSSLLVLGNNSFASAEAAAEDLGEGNDKGGNEEGGHYGEGEDPLEGEEESRFSLFELPNTKQNQHSTNNRAAFYKMGAVVSCIAGMLRAVGACLMAIVNGIGAILQGIIGAIVSFFDILISCLTCGRGGAKDMEIQQRQEELDQERSQEMKRSLQWWRHKSGALPLSSVQGRYQGSDGEHRRSAPHSPERTIDSPELSLEYQSTQRYALGPQHRTTIQTNYHNMMEDPLTMSVNDAFPILDHEMPSFTYLGACLDHQFPDSFNASYLSGAQLSYPTEAGRVDDGPQSSSSASNALDFPKPDDLSHFLSDSSFSSPTPGQRYTALKSQVPHSGYSPTPWDHGLVSTALDSWAQPAMAAAPLSTLTSGFEPVETRTVMNNGHVTPGDSPEEARGSPPKWVKATLVRKQSRKGKVTAAAAASASSATSEENLWGTQGGETNFKKQRKPRRSSKKTTTAEQAAAKRETFLKRNREAAYKCRVKTKTQTAEVVERVKTLGEDNAAKGIEVERLQREVEGLRGLLLPGCEDERVVAYADGLGGVEHVWVEPGGVPAMVNATAPPSAHRKHVIPSLSISSAGAKQAKEKDEEREDWQRLASSDAHMSSGISRVKIGSANTQWRSGGGSDEVSSGFHAMPISTIKSKKQVDYKLVYSRADGMPNSLESMVLQSFKASMELVLRNRIKDANSINFNLNLNLNFNLNINSPPTFGPARALRSQGALVRIVPGYSDFRPWGSLSQPTPTSSIATSFYTTLPQPRPAVTCPSKPHKYDHKYPPEINALYTTSPINEIRGPRDCYVTSPNYRTLSLAPPAFSALYLQVKPML
ncbi:hypothetical protein V501_01427 [Pseudogymnoascus sp. VKM F-4519 (FW-2642)]|nr:hypothetical protein V501_01427 [Pseudogymnoascus sp. VKM F-4519 (FW-2642)]